MATGARLPDHHAALRDEILHYLEEETGHEQWILNDIAQAGGNREAAAASLPAIETEAMVAYAYDQVMRRNPIGFFGMVYVLEGTSVAIALHAADRIQEALRLPAKAFTYLRSHGELDKEHVHHLAGILERLDRDEDRDAVTRCANAMFWLYGNVFRSLDAAAGASGELRKTA
jgi:pyrroloquinoline quinone (PQQ) biosynthesis protein C